MGERLNIEKLKGFRDFYPEDMQYESYISEKAEMRAREYGYSKIDFPSLESLDLYRVKSGEELLEQTFSFTDKGGREVTMIPEATPSTVRMLTSRKDLVKPVRWYSFPKVWRYEDPQAGRYREHYQFNADIFGNDSADADAEIIALAASILNSIGLSNVYEIRINNRELIEYILKSYGINNVLSVFNVIDKFHKISRESFITELQGRGISDEACEEIYTLASKNIDAGKIRSVIGVPGSEEQIDRIEKTVGMIRDYENINVKYDFSIVRGLSYYTGIVFEAYDARGEFRAILGGGRYNELARLFSGQDIPAVGFGMGDAVISLLLKRENVNIKEKMKKYYVCTLPGTNKSYAIRVANTLRNGENIVSMDISSKNISYQLKYAGNYGFDYAVIIGNEEEKNSTVTFKDLLSGNQKTLPFSDIK